MTSITQSKAFESKLQSYADLAINVGLNLRPGQGLLVRNIGSIIALAPFVRPLATAAYRAGARFVDVMWMEEQLDRIRIQYAEPDSLDEFPQWQVNGLLEYAQRGDAVLGVLATNPDLYAGLEPELATKAQQARAKKLRPYSELLWKGVFNWLIICLPEQEWANKVFPNLPSDEQISSLWQAMFETMRLDHSDPVKAWQRHIARLVKYRDHLTQKRYRALKFSGPGTDLTVGLADQHIWQGGQITSRNGITYTPNLPTEEVATMPHCEQIDGVVKASKPLSYGGVLIEDFSLKFHRGRVVNVNAGRGEAALRRLTETDDGASRLGEVALVPHSSPVSQSGLLFYNTLFDENAACHLALGSALRFCMEGGTLMAAEEFLDKGGNVSAIHIDFMIGSEEMDV
ncbi:MAG: aminopeptidase, partial [Anaerolineaceae bacterium]